MLDKSTDSSTCIRMYTTCDIIYEKEHFPAK